MEELINTLKDIGITDLPSTVLVLLFCYYVIMKQIDERLDKIEAAILSVGGTFRTLKSPCDDAQQGQARQP